MNEGGGDLRRRRVPESGEEDECQAYDSNEADDRRALMPSLFYIDMRGGRTNSVLPFTALFALFFVGMTLFLAGLAIVYNLPTPIIEDVDDKFNARRAMDHLSQLESLGPKVTGSFENEVMAVELLVKKIVEIQKEAKPHHNISYEIQRVNGSFHLTAPVLETIVYFYLQNIVVRLSSLENTISSPSLLVNCHFDSVPTSPGASDDGANCAIMLETLRVLSLGPSLTYDVIFLFNGAEENPLMGSHGFIKKHPLAKKVKAFINLESCGAGGKEILFQSGPRNSWLLEKYAQVPHPSALVVAEEIFQSGLVPSETDFRVFRDFGQIPGLDFAHCLNGYVYHTKYDSIKSIYNALGVLQHTGDNLLSLIRSIVNSNDFKSSPKFTDVKPVYFDVFGKYFFVYDVNLSMINWIILLFSAVTFTICQPSFRAVLKRVMIFATMLVTSIWMNFMIAYTMDNLGLSMSWYSNMAVIIMLYFMPPFILSALIMIHMEHFFENRLVNNDCPKRWFSMHLNLLAMHLFWTALFGVLIIFGIRSSYLLIFLIGPNSVMLAILKILKVEPGKAWTFSYISSTLVSSVKFSQLAILVFYLFIPIAGRAGDSKNPDNLISLLSCVFFFTIFCYMIPLMFLVKSNKRWLWTMATFTVIAVITACNSSFVFPFSDLKPQRIIAKHVDRQFYSLNGTVDTDSIVWVQSMDRRGLIHYPNLELKKAIPLERFCKLDPHCGVPWTSARAYLRSMSSLSFYTAPHNALHDFTVENKSEQLAPGLRRYKFVVSGQPDHMVMFIKLRPAAQLESWSFAFKTPIPQLESGTYVIRYVHGQQKPNFKFSIDIEHDSDDQDPLMDLTIIAEKTHESKFADLFTFFISSLPDYAHVTPVVTSYKSFVF